MTLLTEGQHDGEFILYHQPYLSFENVTVTVPANSTIKAGAVLGQLSVGGKYVAYDNNATDGSEAAAAINWANLVNETGAPLDFDAAVIERHAVVRRADIQYEAGQSAGDKTAAEADLLTKDIKFR